MVVREVARCMSSRVRKTLLFFTARLVDEIKFQLIV